MLRHPAILVAVWQNTSQVEQLAAGAPGQSSYCITQVMHWGAPTALNIPECTQVGVCKLLGGHKGRLGLAALDVITFSKW